MAKKVKLVLHKQGFAALRNSAEVLADLTERAELIAAEAERRSNGADFEARAARPGSSFSRRSRGRASVGTTDYRSRAKQAKDNILQIALNAARG